MEKYREENVDLFVIDLLTQIKKSYRPRSDITNPVPEKLNHRTIFSPRRDKQQDYGKHK